MPGDDLLDGRYQEVRRMGALVDGLTAAEAANT